MADETRQVELAIDSKKAEATLARLRKAQEKVAVAVREGKVAADVGAKSLSRLEKKERDLIKVNRILDSSFGKTTEEIEKQRLAADKLSQTLARLDENNSRVRSEIGIVGDVGSAGRTLGGAAGAIGGETGQAIESAISALSELPDSLEAIGQLKPALAGLPAGVQKVTDSIGLGGFAGSIQKVVPALGGAGAAAVALTLPLIAITAAVAALSFAFNALKKQNEAVTKSVRDQFNAQAEVNDLINQGAGSAEIIESRAQALIDLENAQEALASAQAEHNRIIEEGGPLTTLLGAREEEYNRIIREQEELVRENTVRVQEYNAALDNSEVAAIDAARAEQELADSRAEQLAELRDAIKGAQASTLGALQEIGRIGEQIFAAQSQRNQRQADAAASAALEAEFAAEDQQKQESEHRNKLADIANTGRENIETLESGFATLASERTDALAEADTKGNEKLSELRDDFFSAQIEKTEDFQRETVKIETDTAKRRARLLQDINDSLNDASRNNDVIAFLKAQRDGNRKLKEDAEDAQTAEQRRVEEFALARERESEAFREKQAETLAAIATEKQSIIEAFNERRQALADQIEEEKEAIQERLEAERVRYEEQEAREAEQAERQARRDALRAEQEQRDHDARMAQLQAEVEAAQAKHDAEVAALNALQAQLASLQSTINSLSAPTSSSASSSQAATNSPFGDFSFRGGNRTDSRSRNRGNRGASRRSARSGSSNFTAFHDGGQINFAGAQQEGFAFVKKGELIINPDKIAKKGSPSNFAKETGVGKGQAPMINFNPVFETTVGDIASKSEVEAGLRATVDALMQGLVQTVQQASQP